LVIYFRNPKLKTGAFVGHTKGLSVARDRLSSVMFEQFKKQGGRLPIGYPVEVDFVFYVDSAHEPDLDNLPAIVCDALQGISVKGTKLRVASVLENDRLICKVKARRITKGDINYVGEPRTELTVRRFLGSRA